MLRETKLHILVINAQEQECHIIKTFLTVTYSIWPYLVPKNYFVIAPLCLIIVDFCLLLDTISR